jgi:DNA-binding transcriptional ArsR family regulator
MLFRNTFMRYLVQPLISLLLGGEMNVTQLNKNLKLTQPALSQHLSVLRSEGLLGARREQRQVYYSISNAAMTDLIKISHQLIVFKASGKKASAKA